jgi:L-ascorbate metabolism protein UlaG (beta-lactamase superfamily)
MATDDAVTLRWHAQACVTLVSPGGTTVLVDPFDESIGHRLPQVEPDVVITTHNHYDHANLAGVKGRPRILQGLTPDGAWAVVDAVVGDVRLRTVGTYHDELRGAKRGRNSVVVIETGGLSVVHLGDLGHVLSDDQVKAIGPVDVLLVPVGGIYTVGAADARQVVRQLAPRRAVIPMHYMTDSLTLRLEGVEPFLGGWRRVRRLGTNCLRLPVGPVQTQPDGPEVIVMTWEPGEP